MSEKENELIDLIGKDAVESGVKMYQDLYQWNRFDAIDCIRILKGLEDDIYAKSLVVDIYDQS